MRGRRPYGWTVFTLATFWLLSGCVSQPRTVAELPLYDVLREDPEFAVLRVRAARDYKTLARAYLGDADKSWQIKEINPPGGLQSGTVVAVPRKPVNRSSVFSDGYRTIPIICYHQFSDGPAQQRLELSAADLRRQFEYLRDNSFNVLTLDEVVDILEDREPIPPDAVVLTIDDGYRSVYDVAWPIIREFGFPVVLYVYTDFVGGGAALTWAQIREMRASGLVDIQSHGKSHTNLVQLPEDQDESAARRRILDEVRVSTSILEQRLGVTPTYLSYPYGNSSDVAVEVLRSLDISLGATVTRGPNGVFADRYLLHRTMIYDNHSLDDFARFVNNYRKIHR